MKLRTKDIFIPIDNLFLSFVGKDFLGLSYFCLLIFIYFIIHKTVLRNSKLFIILFELPGTFIHELSHASIVVLTGGKIESFTILPKFEKTRIVLGSVRHYSNKNAIPFISIAPFFLNSIFLFIFTYFINKEYLYNLNIFYSVENFIFSYIRGIIITSSLLSSTDMKNAIKYSFNKIPLIFMILIIIICIFEYSIILDSINYYFNFYEMLYKNSILFFISTLFIFKIGDLFI